ncbi:MAG: WD40/YVTN/BNR-like repeat-containing protein [Bradymonadaceae bacterium]
MAVSIAAVSCSPDAGSGASDAGCTGDACVDGGGGLPGQWREPFDAREFGWLLSVAGHSPDDVYAVGGTPADGRIMHWDGESWSEMSVPDGVPLINWVHVFDDGTPIFAGNNGTILRRRGGDWQVQDPPTDQDLWGVWGASTNDIWSVGGSGTEEGEAVVVRNRGDGWKKVDVPELERPNVFAFFKVWGMGPDDVYIVGQRGAVLHWDGQELTEQFVGSSKDMISVWGSGPDDVSIIGGRAGAVLAHWDGSEWTAHDVPGLPGANGIWMPREGVAWVAGNAGRLARVRIQKDGLSVRRAPYRTRLDFHAIFGFSGRQLYSVGGSLSRTENPTGIAITRSLE